MIVAHEENCVGCMLCYQICPDFCIAVTVKAGLEEGAVR
jgi:NAD-dependent dihydropyrimidine dehydrogenase PreA subunit